MINIAGRYTKAFNQIITDFTEFNLGVPQIVTTLTKGNDSGIFIKSTLITEMPDAPDRIFFSECPIGSADKLAESHIELCDVVSFFIKRRFRLNEEERGKLKRVFRQFFFLSK